VPRDRVLLEDGKIATDIAASMMVGNYQRGDRVIHKTVALEPAADHQPVFLVDDRATGECIGVINAGAIETARDLRDLVDDLAEVAAR
jgi:hypothetical protein